MIIDIHNHFYPMSYIESLRENKGYASVKYDSQGRLIIQYEGDYNIIVRSHIDISDRLKVMDKFGIDMQVLTLTTPGVERENIDVALGLARKTNDDFSDIVEKYPDRFSALAALPLQAPELAVEELRRAVIDLGLKGAIIFSNINGKPLDLKEFWVIYEEAARLDVPIFIHPTSPINLRFMEDYRIVPIFGFTVDTSLAVLRLILSGVLEKYPTLKVIAAHVGGVLPYLIGRIDKCFQMYPESKQNISNPPSYYMKNIYVDSICYDQKILEFVYKSLGSDKIMLGTDYPHQITDIEKAVERVKNLNIPGEDEENILSKNAIKLFKL